MKLILTAEVDHLGSAGETVEVKDGACQEVVLEKNFDVWDVVPMISHSDSDPGRTLAYSCCDVLERQGPARIASAVCEKQNALLHANRYRYLTSHAKAPSDSIR